MASAKIRKIKPNNPKNRATIVVDAVRKFTQDTWANVITGFGTTRDKVTYSEFDRRDPLTIEELEALYNQDDMASRVCDVIPEEALRQGFKVKIAASDDEPHEVQDDPENPAPTLKLTSTEALAASKRIYKKLRTLKATKKLIEAAVWGRLFGGSVILIGANDGLKHSKPINPKRLKDINFLNVIDKQYIIPYTWNEDPLSPDFGEPSTYLITPQSTSGYSLDPVGIQNLKSSPGIIEVHSSRLIIFEGTRTTSRRKQQNWGFGESALERFYDPLRNFQISWQSITHLLQDSPQAKFKIKGLMDMISSGDKQVIQDRMEITDLCRSVARAIILDAEDEDFERQATTFTDIPDLMDKIMIRLSAAARMPVTILMGQSPAGLDATGESDIRWFYDQVHSYQTEDLGPKIEYLIYLIMASSQGPTRGMIPDEWEIEFPSLWQLSPLEEAKVRKEQAETDNINIQNGTLLPEEVALSRFGIRGYCTDTSIDLSTRVEVLALKLEKILKFTKEMPQFGLPKGWQAQFLPTGVPGSEEEEYNRKKAELGPEKPEKPEKTDASPSIHVHNWLLDGKQVFSSICTNSNIHTHLVNGYKTTENDNIPGHTHTIVHNDTKLLSGPPVFPQEVTGVEEG